MQGFYRNVAPCVATCKGFKGNVELLSLCARFYGNMAPCVAMCKGVRDRRLGIESKPGNLNGSCERDAEAGVLEFH